MKFSVSTFAIFFAFIGLAVADLGRRQDPNCLPGSIAPNPLSMTVPAGSVVEVTAESHAANLQQLTVDPGVAGMLTTSFVGAGEDIPMHIRSGGIDLGFTLTIPAQPTERQITLTFTFSTNQGFNFNLATVRCPIVDAGIVTITTVKSEDASDNDNNDTLATVLFIG